MRGDTYLRQIAKWRNMQVWHNRPFLREPNPIRYAVLRGDLPTFSKSIGLPLSGNEKLARKFMAEARSQQAAAIRQERKTGLLKRDYRRLLGAPGELLRGTLVGEIQNAFTSKGQPKPFIPRQVVTPKEESPAGWRKIFS